MVRSGLIRTNAQSRILGLISLTISAFLVVRSEKPASTLPRRCPLPQKLSRKFFCSSQLLSNEMIRRYHLFSGSITKSSSSARAASILSEPGLPQADFICCSKYSIWKAMSARLGWLTWRILAASSCGVDGALWPLADYCKYE